MEISATAHINAMKIAKPGIMRAWAELISTFVARGQDPTYPSIVA